MLNFTFIFIAKIHLTSCSFSHNFALLCHKVMYTQSLGFSVVVLNGNGKDVCQNLELTYRGYRKNVGKMFTLENDSNLNQFTHFCVSHLFKSSQLSHISNISHLILYLSSQHSGIDTSSVFCTKCLCEIIFPNNDN